MAFVSKAVITSTVPYWSWRSVTLSTTTFSDLSSSPVYVWQKSIWHTFFPMSLLQSERSCLSSFDLLATHAWHQGANGQCVTLCNSCSARLGSLGCPKVTDLLLCSLYSLFATARCMWFSRFTLNATSLSSSFFLLPEVGNCLSLHASWSSFTVILSE